MTQSDALSLIYARSLYDLADEAGGRDKIIEISEELEQICELARSDHALREFFASPIIDPSRRGESLRRIFNDRITDLTLRFLLVLNNKGRLAHLEAISSTFDHLVQEAFGQIEVDLFTPKPLEDGQVELTVLGEDGAFFEEMTVLPSQLFDDIDGVLIPERDPLLGHRHAQTFKPLVLDVFYR